MKAFDSKIKMQAKALYVEKHLTVEEIAEFFNNTPSKSTIANWANEKDKNEKTWEDYRREDDEFYYSQLTPGGMARMFHERLSRILQDNNLQAGEFGDAVRKLTASMKDIIDPGKQIGVIYQVLSEILDHAEQQYREDKEHLIWLAELLKTYRDKVKERLSE